MMYFLKVNFTTKIFLKVDFTTNFTNCFIIIGDMTSDLKAVAFDSTYILGCQ